MKLLTEDQERQMRKNGMVNAARRARGLECEDFQPVVKLFCPWSEPIWLLSELDPGDPDLAFGLCDLGMGHPELGIVRISELEAIRGPAPWLRIESDPEFKPSKTLQAYADEARRAGCIQA
jgi:hypothetical protein